MTEAEWKVWAATFAVAYVQEMDLGRRRGLEPTPGACSNFAHSAVDIADSAVYALRDDSVRADSDLLEQLRETLQPKETR